MKEDAWITTVCVPCSCNYYWQDEYFCVEFQLESSEYWQEEINNQMRFANEFFGTTTFYQQSI